MATLGPCRDESIPKLSDIVREATQPTHHLMAQLTSQQVGHWADLRPHLPEKTSLPFSLSPLPSLQVEAESNIHRELLTAVSQLPFPDPSIAMEPPP